MVNERFKQPTPIDNLTVVFGAGPGFRDLMPAMHEIPEEFKRGYGNIWVDHQRQWFFKGLDTRQWYAKPGIDRRAAFAHLSAIQGSFESSHEHKEAAVAYLMSLWFEVPGQPLPGTQAAKRFQASRDRKPKAKRKPAPKPVGSPMLSRKGRGPIPRSQLKGGLEV